jgi:hypothetical protein
MVLYSREREFHRLLENTKDSHCTIGIRISLQYNTVRYSRKRITTRSASKQLAFIPQRSSDRLSWHCWRTTQSSWELHTSYSTAHHRSYPLDGSLEYSNSRQYLHQSAHWKPFDLKIAKSFQRRGLYCHYVVWPEGRGKDDSR